MEEYKYLIKAHLKSNETLEDIFNIHHEGVIEFKSKEHVLRYFRDFRIIYDNSLIYDEYFKNKYKKYC